MRRGGVAGLLAVALIAGTAGGTIGQAEADDEDGVRIEIAERGFAVTFPDEWRLYRTLDTDADGLIETYGIGRDFADELVAMGASGIGLVARHQIAGGTEGCQVATFGTGGRTLDDLVAQQVDAVIGRGQLITEPTTMKHAWPAGDVTQVDFVYRTASGGEFLNSTWHYSDGARYHILACAGQIDLGAWSSIAETFELLAPPDRSATSVRGPAMSGRIERPERGFALTFPAGWEVWESTDELQLELFGRLPDDDQTPLLFAQHSSGPWCQVIDFTAYALSPPPTTDVEEAADLYSIEGADVWSEEVAIGRVGRSHGTRDDGWTNEIFTYLHADHWIALLCDAASADQDPVIIGQSFEIIPTD